jgi:hypothetical protein
MVAYATSRVSAPGTDWREDVASDEAERFERHAETLRDYQRRNGRKSGPGRALHRKAHAGLEAELEVRDGLAPEARAGLFAAPGRYRAYVRFSNGLGMHQPDWLPDVRGLAVKVLGVPGRKLIPGLEDATTQDFLLISTPALPFSNVDEFIAFVKSAESQALALPRVVRAFGPARAAKLFRFLAGMGPPSSLATVPYFTALPLRWGDYAGKAALFPVDAPAPAAKYRGGDRLAAELADRLAKGPVRFAMKVQLYLDETSTPIEDAAVTWDAPFVEVGSLEIPQQDLRSAQGREVAELVEKLSFDPWHALEAHRPLGNLMRARSNAYRMSTQARGAAPEPAAT